MLPCRALRIIILSQTVTAGLKQASSSANIKRLILERIIKENEERHEHERRVNTSVASAASPAACVANEDMARDIVSTPVGHKNDDAKSPSAGFSCDGKVPAPLKLNVQVPAPEDFTPDEGNPWSPSKRWTACAEVFSSSWRESERASTKLPRTSSLGLGTPVRLAQDMWRRIYDMEAQQKQDRSMRRRLWLIEVVLISFSVFVCVRIGSPEIMCAAHEGVEGIDRAALLWHNTVCGSWGGLITPAALSDHSEILSLQEERTRFLHQALDSMVAHSARK